MTFLFEAILKNGGICCTITAEQTLENSVFCFSLMAPGSVAAGGHLIRRVGGFHEVQLPALAAGHPHVIELTYDDPNIGVKNRAWLPLGSYLRVGDACHSLPSLELGVRAGQEPSFDAYDGLPLVPAPTHWKPALGTVRAEGFWFSDDQLDKVNALAMRTSAKLFKSQAGLAVIVQRQADMPQEGYVLSITPEKVVITAAAHSGIFYAGITLLNLFITTNGLLPCGRIEDQPRFPWRGQHLDCARHFFKTDTITGLLDLMALLKLNRFHWHFSDDEAFRIEIPNLPEVWQKSRCRGEGAYMPGAFGGGMKACGSYSVSDVERIVAHAKALHIEVLPEIEIPAHSYVLNQIFPEMRDPDDTGVEESVQGYRGNVTNPACAKTWEVIGALIDGIAPLFPFGYLHLGCDELPPMAWSGSSRIARFKQQHGLKTADDVSAWVMRKAAGLAGAKNMRPAAWEEAARGAGGGIGNDALLFIWQGQVAGVEAARAGYDVVMCPAQNVYFDMAHTSDPADWGASWAAIVALEETINWDPVPAGAQDIADKVVGVQGAFWGEFTQQDHQIEPMLAPRILGLATKAWSQQDALTGPDLKALAGHYRAVFDALGWQWNTAA